MGLGACGKTVISPRQSQRIARDAESEVRFEWQKHIRRSTFRRRAAFALSNEQFLNPDRARFGLGWKHVESATVADFK